MVQYDKVNGMLYEVDGRYLRLHVTEEYRDIEEFKRCSDVHIEKKIDTSERPFWDMVFDSCIELKQRSIDYIADEDQEATEQGIKFHEEQIVNLRALEIALRPMVSNNRREVEP